MSAKFSVAPPSLSALVDRQIDALDQLASDVRGGIKSAHHFNELDERACEIGEKLRAAFRTVRARR